MMMVGLRRGIPAVPWALESCGAGGGGSGAVDLVGGVDSTVGAVTGTVKEDGPVSTLPLAPVATGSCGKGIGLAGAADRAGVDGAAVDGTAQLKLHGAPGVAG